MANRLGSRNVIPESKVLAIRVAFNIPDPGPVGDAQYYNQTDAVIVNRIFKDIRRATYRWRIGSENAKRLMARTVDNYQANKRVDTLLGLVDLGTK